MVLIRAPRDGAHVRRDPVHCLTVCERYTIKILPACIDVFRLLLVQLSGVSSACPRDGLDAKAQGTQG